MHTRPSPDRTCAGPMFVKYNIVLRAASGRVAALIRMAEELTKGNTYPTTLAVLNRSIVKLSMIQRADRVYRAPGGALPASFWQRDEYNACGGVEMAFLSATTSKQVGAS